MNNKLHFFITDVFGIEKYSGNQLATFLNCDSLSDGEMQQMAREINFSETTFILSDTPVNGGYNVRIFTPQSEVDFAGHPTLGTAFIIQKYLIPKPIPKVILNLKAGQVPVLFPEAGKDDDFLWMHQIEPTFGETLKADTVARVLGIREDDLDQRWPIEEISTGLPFLIVPLKSLEILKQVTISRDKYLELINNLRAKAILVFCPEGYAKEQRLSVRVFVDYFGIPEDPATGSGNGCLAAYLVKNRYFNSDRIEIQVGQGYEVGRPSLLSLRGKEQDGRIKIEVGGRVIQIAEGLWS